MGKMINWQRIWDDDGSTIFYKFIKIIVTLPSYFYLLIINVRNWLYDHKIFKEAQLSCPVISVGNITVGGTGKTPCVILLAKMLQENGFKPAVISRGYGGKNTNPVNIVSDGDKILLDARIAGDEPFLIAQSLKNIPVLTGAKRIMTGKAAINQLGANVLICDDAMQHRQIFRDINLVLLDANTLQKNDYILPRGRLREPLKELKRASAIILTRANEGKQKIGNTNKLTAYKNIPVFQSVHEPQGIIKGDYSTQKPLSELRGKKVCAFCGIANPDSFKNTLFAAGAQILFFDFFSDHHRYTKKELEQIRKNFMDSGGDFLISTEKDAARLKEFPEVLNIIYLLRISLNIIPSVDQFNKFILERLAARKN
jgi:tetraacyldisaccharide 4'-kinase